MSNLTVKPSYCSKAHVRTRKVSLTALSYISIGGVEIVQCAEDLVIAQRINLQLKEGLNQIQKSQRTTQLVRKEKSAQQTFQQAT